MMSRKILNTPIDGKSTQAGRQKKGQGGDPPCRVKGQRPLWGFGQRPNCFTGEQLCQTRSIKGAGSEASLPVTKKPSNTILLTWVYIRRSPEGDRKALWKLLFLPLQ